MIMAASSASVVRSTMPDHGTDVGVCIRFSMKTWHACRACVGFLLGDVVPCTFSTGRGAQPDPGCNKQKP